MNKRFNHSTLTIKAVKDVKLNTSATKIWISEDLNLWAALFKKWRNEGDSIRSKLELQERQIEKNSLTAEPNNPKQRNPEHFYTSWRWDYIVKLSELQSIIEVQEFFEKLVQAKVDAKTKYASSKSAYTLRKFLSDSLNASLVLMPMTRRGRITWFPYSPAIKRECDLAVNVANALSTWSDPRLGAVASSFFGHTDIKKMHPN